MQVLDDRDPNGSADHFLRSVAMFRSQGLSVAAACLQSSPTVLVLYKRQCKAPWRHRGASGG